MNCPFIVFFTDKILLNLKHSWCNNSLLYMYLIKIYIQSVKNILQQCKTERFKEILLWLIQISRKFFIAFSSDINACVLDSVAKEIWHLFIGKKKWEIMWTSVYKACIPVEDGRDLLLWWMYYGCLHTWHSPRACRKH